MVLGRRINTRKNIYIFGDLMIFRSLPRTVQRVRRLYCIYWIWRLKFMIDFWSNISIYIWHFYPTVILYGYQRDSHDLEHSCFKIILALCLIFLTVKRQSGSLKNSFLFFCIKLHIVFLVKKLSKIFLTPFTAAWAVYKRNVVVYWQHTSLLSQCFQVRILPRSQMLRGGRQGSLCNAGIKWEKILPVQKSKMSFLPVFCVKRIQFIFCICTLYNVQYVHIRVCTMYWGIYMYII